ncbi:MAG: cytochrome bd ubiquinol oxidase [Trebouxia sp. A1-2]|nr:MAG: cytochrome bd ubiquinol oxidase [Trebouxia sp. A1-2]
MFDPVLTWAARKYQAAVATELKKYGLRYEDLYDPQLNMDTWAEVQAENTEKAMLGTGKDYDRSFP